MTAKEILFKYWNYPSFKTPQEEIISNVLEDKDTLAILPTGGGKSLCYQVPAIMFDGLTLVISPLIALMKDQVQNLTSKGISTAYITNEIDQNTIGKILDDCQNNRIKLLYVSPERLQSRIFIERLKQINISLLAVDEAHCVSEWGHDFRPAYHRIARLKTILPKVPILALTATATEKIQLEIIEKLELNQPQIFKSSLKRENLSYNVFLSTDKKKDLIYYLKKYSGSSIIFVRNRKLTYEIANFLSQNGFDADYFHAKLTKDEKEEKQRNWMLSNSRIMVSTNAFGMGIDKPNVRTVFHIDLPQGIEAYYQEVGRAGRDEQESHGIYLYHPDDRIQAENIFKANLPSQQDFIKISNCLFSQLQLAEGELTEMNYQLDIPKFAEKFGLNLKMVLQFLDFLNTKEIIQQKNYTQNSTLQILASPHSINQGENQIFDYLQRHYPGIYTYSREISESKMAFDLHRSIGDIRNALHDYYKNGTIDYSDRFLARFRFLIPRDSNAFKNKLWKDFESIQVNNWKRLQAMIYYAEQNTICRERLLFGYFNQKSDENCGKCDVCQSKKQTKNFNANDLIEYLKEGEKTQAEILSKFINLPKDIIVEELQYLIDEMRVQPIGFDSYKLIE
ncbi:RecQ family ATP-dependent DNA helicase [Empedobacter falsenii]